MKINMNLSGGDTLGKFMARDKERTSSIRTYLRRYEVIIRLCFGYITGQVSLLS